MTNESIISNVTSLGDARFRKALSELLESTQKGESKEMKDLIPFLNAFGLAVDQRIFKRDKTLEEIENYYIDIINNLYRLLLTATGCLAANQFKEIYQPKIDVKLGLMPDEGEQGTLFNIADYDLESPEDLREDVANKNNKTGYLGVTLRKGRYISHIWHDPLREPGRKHSQQGLGSYSNPIQAAQIRDQAAKYLHGENARLNFPDKEST